MLRKAKIQVQNGSVRREEKVMKLLDRKGYDATIIEDPTPFTVEISKYQKYSELLKNSIESYPMRDKVILVMKDMVLVEQALAMGAILKAPK